VFTRFVRFNVVGLLGVGVQLGAAWILVGLLHLHYLVGSAVAIELSVLHNFVWHERWTWSERGPARPPRGRFRPGAGVRCLGFHAGNGLVSLLGSLALLPFFVGVCGLHYLVANLGTAAATGLLNFLLGDRVIFRGEPGARG
jgi:putative flippase GtrA